jgi:hypothetical protein
MNAPFPTFICFVLGFQSIEFPLPAHVSPHVHGVCVSFKVELPVSSYDERYKCPDPQQFEEI